MKTPEEIIDEAESTKGQKLHPKDRKALLKYLKYIEEEFKKLIEKLGPKE